MSGHVEGQKMKEMEKQKGNLLRKRVIKAFKLLHSYGLNFIISHYTYRILVFRDFKMAQPNRTAAKKS